MQLKQGKTSPNGWTQSPLRATQHCMTEKSEQRGNKNRRSRDKRMGRQGIGPYTGNPSG